VAFGVESSDGHHRLWSYRAAGLRDGNMPGYNSAATEGGLMPLPRPFPTPPAEVLEVRVVAGVASWPSGTEMRTSNLGYSREQPDYRVVTICTKGQLCPRSRSRDPTSPLKRSSSRCAMDYRRTQRGSRGGGEQQPARSTAIEPARHRLRRHRCQQVVRRILLGGRQRVVMASGGHKLEVGRGLATELADQGHCYAFEGPRSALAPRPPTSRAGRRPR
jgi:hypothetical protein